MTMAQVRPLYNAALFKPFILHLADGPEIPVKHREFMALSPSGTTITVYQAGDTSHIIDLLLVTDLEVTNGKAPRSRHPSRQPGESLDEIVHGKWAIGADVAFRLLPAPT